MTLEREIKLAAFPELVMPPPVVGLRAVDRGTQLLDATYWDTDSLDLFRSHHGLRYRTRDGVDGVWTLKGPSLQEGSAVVRAETEVPGSSGLIPDALLTRLRTMLGGSLPHPVAQVRTERHTVELWAGDLMAAELDDDRVIVLDAEGRPATRFRELELELCDGAPDSLVDEEIAALRAAGATVDPTSKYQRALKALGFSLAAPEQH